MLQKGAIQQIRFREIYKQFNLLYNSVPYQYLKKGGIHCIKDILKKPRPFDKGRFKALILVFLSASN